MPLSFLSPWYLLAGLAAVIPIIIHLLQRRREVTLPFAMVRFVLAARKRSSRRLKLRRYLLLLLRVLAILLLATVLARPVLRSEEEAADGGGAGHSAVIIDNSLSMAARSGDRSRFETALDLAREAAGALPGGERLVLIPVAVEESAPPAVWGGQREFTEALGGVHLLPRKGDFTAALREAYVLLREAGAAGRRILIFTDLARGGWEDFSLISVSDADTAVPVAIYRIGGGDPEGAGIVGVTVGGESGISGEKRSVEATVLNWGPEQTVAVELLLDGVARDRRVATVPPGGEGSVTFEVTAAGEGDLRGELRLAEDDYGEDDGRFFVLSQEPPVPVLVVDGEQRLSLVESESFFLREALRSEALSRFQPMEVTVVTPEALEGVELGDYRVVILANVPGPPAGRRLVDFVGGGGGLVVFWGENCSAVDYRRLAPGLLPAQPLETAAAPAESAFRIAELDYEHRVFSLFRSPGEGTFETAAFSRRLEVGGIAAGGRVPGKFADGAPWMVEGSVGEGTVVLFTSTADLAWNDLPTKPVFVPLLRRTVLALSSTLLEAEQEDLAVGEARVFAGGEELGAAAATVTDPDGREWSVPFLPAGDGARAEFAGTGRRGYYGFSYPGAGGLFAVNGPPGESDIRPLDEEELRSRFQQVPLSVTVFDGERGREDIRQQGARSLSRPFFFILFFLLLLEMLIAGSPSLRSRS